MHTYVHTYIPVRPALCLPIEGFDHTSPWPGQRHAYHDEGQRAVLDGKGRYVRCDGRTWRETSARLITVPVRGYDEDDRYNNE